MAINSKAEICNLALGHLGNYGTVSNIDTPTNDKEITCELWYDITRQVALKLIMPNFSLARKPVSLVTNTANTDRGSGYSNGYEYPNDCLKALGIGNIDLREDNYAIEGNVIYTNVAYEDGLPLRYVKDITDVNFMSPEFKMLLSWFLAANIAWPITQDREKVKLIEELLPGKMSAYSGLNAQENRPTRISRSKYLEARRHQISPLHGGKK